VEKEICWDAHSCVPLNPGYVIGSLDRHRRNGFHFVSINIGMDLNPVVDILQIIGSFRRQIAAHPNLLLAESIEDVESAAKTGSLAVAFDLEGAKPVMGNADMIAVYRALGVRQMHFAYNRGNEVAGGCYDPEVSLQPLGRRFVRECERVGIMIDCSHLSERSALEIMEIATKPVIFSHSNIRRLNGDLRNITDAMIDSCAASGGVIGITGMSRLLENGRATVDAMASQIDYVVQRAGPGHAGIGLDYVYDRDQDKLPADVDPSYWFPKEHGYDDNYYKSCEFVPPEALLALRKRLVGLGYGYSHVGAIMGGNFARVARRCWQPCEVGTENTGE
jgi:membrane dipeptidase